MRGENNELFAYGYFRRKLWVQLLGQLQILQWMRQLGQYLL